MEHRLVTAIGKALGWADGPVPLGTEFARGHIDDEDLPARLMTPNGMLDLIRLRHLSNPQLRCYADGAALHPARFLASAVTRRRQANRRADMAAVGAILNGGGTAILDTVNDFDPTMEVACRALGWWTGELLSANLYLAAGETKGFALHWDDHDVLCLQLAGEKSWEVRGPSRLAPMYRDAEENLEPPEEILWAGTMKPGDIMHIPRGFWHQATRIGSGGDGCSLHVTFGTTKRTGVTWISALADEARRHELFRTDLRSMNALDPDELVRQVAELARTFSPDRYLEEFRTTTPPARHTPYVPAFGPLTGVVAVTEFEPIITEDPEVGTVQVKAADKNLTFAGRAAPALRTLLSGHPVCLANASEDATTLATHLIEEGLCAPLTDTSSSGFTDLVPAVSF